MSETMEVQALEKISTEVGDSQIKITVSSQCIKAQAFLVDKLRNQTERQKEICNFIKSNNLKLQTEIRQAEIEIKSLMVAKETIKASNVELKKEFLLMKERKLEVKERVSDGEMKYEEMWVQAKARYESIPFVKKLIQSQNKTETYKENLLALQEKSENLTNEIDVKKKFIADLDRKRIIELAQYMVRDLPEGIKVIEEKTKALKEISKNIDEQIKQRDIECIKANTAAHVLEIKEKKEIETEKRKNSDKEWFNLIRDDPPDTIMMPQIQLIQSDFDALSAKLDMIKTKRIDMINMTPTKRVDPNEPDTGIQSKKLRKDEEYSIFFDRTTNDKGGETLDTKKDFSKRKLINILEDIKLDQNDTYEILSKVDTEKLKGVQKIGTDANDEKQTLDSNIETEQANEDIEIIDLTKSSNNLLVPPTQFLDFEKDNYLSSSQQQVEVIVHMSTSDSDGKASQNFRESKKRVCFDLPMTIEEINEDNDSENSPSKDPKTEMTVKETEAVNDTLDSQVNISVASEDDYTKIKEIILRKHNLDLSPQFFYAKNKTLQRSNTANENIVTSKFFQTSKTDAVCKTNELPDLQENSEKVESKVISQNPCDEDPNRDDEIVVSSPKAKSQRPERSITGLLFNHGAQGIPDSLNVSISTGGFEEGDSDFPHCIDSSLLLSPKADFPMPNSGENPEVLSQDVPNFLSGLRKTGFSFFGQSTDSKASTSEQNQNNFNFNFGGDEKKGRGGLFNMFR